MFQNLSKLALVAISLFLYKNAEAISADCSKFGAQNKILYSTPSISTADKIIFCNFGDEFVSYETLETEASQKLETEALNGFLSTVERRIVIRPDGSFERPSLSFCLQIKGDNHTIFDEAGNEWGVCTFSDGSVISDWTLFRGVQNARSDKLAKFIHTYR